MGDERTQKKVGEVITVRIVDGGGPEYCAFVMVGHDCIKGYGNSPNDALGHLVRHNPELFSVKILD
ncbi:MAG TPA: hypothetical protein PK367_02980 [Candidatus Paceibacterota bacterium]|nr:hypothetical protein [Candidatus Paceibacterota bacterium]